MPADKDTYAANIRSTFKATTPAREEKRGKGAKPKPAAAAPESVAAPGDVQVTLYMPPELLMQVDQLLLKMRPNFPKGSMMKRAGLVRALLGALIASGADLSDARSEDDVRAIVAERLGRRR